MHFRPQSDTKLAEEMPDRLMYRDLFRVDRYLKDPFNIRKTNISFTNISVS